MVKTHVDTSVSKETAISLSNKRPDRHFQGIGGHDFTFKKFGPSDSLALWNFVQLYKRDRGDNKNEWFWWYNYWFLWNKLNA